MSAIFTEDRGILEAPMRANIGPAGPRRDAADRQARWIVLFLVVAVAIRLIRYLLRFPLWGDEAMLAMNFLGRDYAGLMRPLAFHQVAPLLFLWTELTAVKLFGFNEWSLRLFPLLCGLASVFLFYRLARLLTRGTARVLAVAIFAVTYSGIRYSAEVKPYCVDLMLSTLLLLLAVRWWRQPDQTRWLWALTAVVPLAVGLSYPAVFIGGGVSLAVATVLLGMPSKPEAQASGDAFSSRLRVGLRSLLSPGGMAWVAYNLALVGSFLAWYKLSIGVQSSAELKVMKSMWGDTFPPRDSIVSLLGWLLRVHAGPLLAVPFGGDHFGSIGTTLLCLVAVGVLFRQSRYRLLVLCFVPFALNLIAAALQKFPYGGHMRLAMHLAPLVSILAGIGAAAVIEWLSRKRSALVVPPLGGIPPTMRTWCPGGTTSALANWFAPRTGRAEPRPAENAPSEPLSRPVAVVLVVLLLLAAVSTGRDFYSPGKEEQEIRKRDFAVWFWGSMERNHEVVSVFADLKQIFVPAGDWWENCVSPQFLCSERIYSPRCARGQAFDLSRVSRERPLLCVQYWSHLTPYDQAAFQVWLDGMKLRYDLIASERYPILTDNDDDRVPEPPDRVETYTFVPKGTGAVVPAIWFAPRT